VVYTWNFTHKARRERVGALVIDGELREVMKAKLEDTWSPQQISAWL